MNLKTCPKCGYTRNETDTAPEYECPRCGVVYAKRLAAQRNAAAELAAKKAREDEDRKPAQQELTKVEAPAVRHAGLGHCRTCGGTVARQVKSCPHCGQRKPVGKSPRTPVRPWLKWAGVGVGAVIVLSGALESMSPKRAPSPVPMNFGAVAAYDGSAGSIEAALGYSTMLGRAGACGVDVQRPLDNVARWMSDAGPVVMRAVADKMMHEARLQATGKTPDACDSVRATAAKVTWPE